MGNSSQAGTLISDTVGLEAIKDTKVRIYYPYFLLAEKLIEVLNELWIKENKSFLDNIKIIEAKPANLRLHRLETIDVNVCLEIKRILIGILGKKIYQNKLVELERPSLSKLDPIVLDKYLKDLDVNWVLRQGVVRNTIIENFFRRAKSCNYKLKPPKISGHTSLKLMDLIAVCSGYENFRDFLSKEFGSSYDIEKDEILQALLRSNSNYKSNKSHKTKAKSSSSQHTSNNGKPSEIEEMNEEEDKNKTNTQNVENHNPRISKSRKWIILSSFVTVFVFLGLVIIFSTGNEVLIEANITTTKVNFEFAEPVTFRSKEQFLFSSEKLLKFDNGLYSLNYPYSDTLPVGMLIKSKENNPIGIEYLSIPLNSEINLETVVQNDVYLSFSKTSGIEGYVEFDNAFIYSGDGNDSILYSNKKGILFQSEKNSPLAVTLSNPKEFEIPPVFLTSIHFGTQYQDNLKYGIQSAEINLPELGKSINLMTGDLLNFTFAQPVKALLSYRNGVFIIKFSGKVNSLFAGPEIYGFDKRNNQMPTKLELYFMEFGIYILSVAILFILGIYFIPKAFNL
jgi:hypothetical protein